MRKKWFKGMAAFLSAALLLSAPGVPVRADYASEDGQAVPQERLEAADRLVEVAEDAAEAVRSVSGGDAEIIYPAPRVEWLDKWQLQVELPEVADMDDTVGGFEVSITKDGETVGTIYGSGHHGGKRLFQVSRMIMESGLYSFTAYFYGDRGGRISETTTVEREYVAPSEKLGTTTAVWHDGTIPQVSFAEVPHAEWYEVTYYRDGQLRGWGYVYQNSIGGEYKDGIYWLDERTMKTMLSSSHSEGEEIPQAGEYAVTVQAYSEDITLYANGDEGPLSEPFAFDGVFGKISTGDIAQVKEGLTNEKVTEIEYNLPEGTQVSESDQAEIFSALKGKDKSLTLSFRNEDHTTGYQWTFDGTEIVDDTKTMNFQIIVDANVQDVIDCVDTSRLNEVDLAFLHEGGLPGRATVTVNLGGRLGDAETAHLYYYNPETRQLEIVAENLAVVNGQVAFPMSHCSNYILTAEMLKDLIPDREPEKPETKPDPKPDTGSNQPVAVQAQINPEPVFTSVVSYVVEPGDTLKKIAAKFYGSRDYWTKIYADNAGSIADPNRIYPGQVLFICLTGNPGEEKDVAAGEIYTVQPGDSLWKIAKRIYGKGLLYARIYEANREVIANPKSLRVGQKIVLPQ